MIIARKPQGQPPSVRAFLAQKLSRDEVLHLLSLSRREFVHAHRRKDETMMRTWSAFFNAAKKRARRWCSCGSVKYAASARCQGCWTRVRAGHVATSMRHAAKRRHLKRQIA